MPMLPPINAIQAVFGSSSLAATLKPEGPGAPAALRSRYQAREDKYSAWSVKDDIKAKAVNAEEAAVQKFEKSSTAAQQKVGAIELYSAKYYAACTFGGMVACVR
jgi:solute carrier family 25 phosphate transporter 3